MTEARARPLDIAAWACYLACSWTWSIGMFLPVLLIRDYGPLSFAVFAVPNVLGAALMGVVLARPGASEFLLAHHAAAVRAFSIVTLAFQWFFLVWLVMGIGLSPFGISAAVGSILIAGAAGRADRPTPLAAAVLAFSLAMIAWWFTTPDAKAAIAPEMAAAARPTAIPWLAPVCFFGFGLCPYLDRSFHEARQRLPGRPGTWAFVIGFGVPFAAMILFTFAYAPSILANSPRRIGPQWAHAAVNLHMAVQLAFTAGLHARFAARSGRGDMNDSFVFVPVVTGIALALLGFTLPGLRALSLNEFTYRAFMSFYALLFPAYVWLCVIPTRRSQTRPTTRHIALWAAACALAAPAVWMGFIERQEPWLAPGVAVVLLARLLLPKAHTP